MCKSCISDCSLAKASEVLLLPALQRGTAQCVLECCAQDTKGFQSVAAIGRHQSPVQVPTKLLLLLLLLLHLTLQLGMAVKVQLPSMSILHQPAAMAKQRH
jgi:hypothetical protein